MSLQIWIDEKSDKQQVVALSDEGIYFEKLESEQAEALVSQLQAGESPDVLFGEDADHIPLRRLAKVTVDRNDDNDIELYFGEGKERKNTTLSVDAKEMRDAIYSALRESTSSRFSEYVDQYNIPRAAFASLATFSLFALLTWALMAAASAIRAAEELDITGRKRALKQAFAGVLDFLGPTGVGIIGGILCLLALFVLVSRIKKPQLMYILQSKPYKSGTAIGTSVKYALLFGVWIWVAMVVI